VTAIVRPFLVGYEGVPYLAVPNTDDSFGFDRGGLPAYNAVPHFSSPNLPAGLFFSDDFPNSGGNLRAMLRGVPTQPGNFFPTVNFRLWGGGALAELPIFKGPVELRILPAPKYTVLNPVERAPWMPVHFKADGPALLRVQFGDAGVVLLGSAVRSADGVATQKVYFEAYVEAVGHDHSSFVGANSIDGVPGGTTSMADTWAYGFAGGIRAPNGGWEGKRIDNGTAYFPTMLDFPDTHHPVWKTLPSKVVRGDIIMVALDASAKKMWFGKNGRWFFLGDPAKGAAPAVSGFTNGHRDFHAVVGGSMGTVVTMNFGDQKWRYPPPAGFNGIPHRRAALP